MFITGGSSGLGRATADHFARNGWSVGLISRNAAGLAASAAGVRARGVPAAFAQADVADLPAVEAAAAALAAVLGPPDVWINCAGNGVYGRFADTTPEEFDRVTSVTYGGVVNGCRVALALMRPQRRGVIVNVCSAMAFHGLPLMTSYAGAKAAVRGFGQALQAELAVEGSPLRVTTVYPPALNTPFFSHAPSHMRWPARPAPPVYQPEVAAAGLYLAALTSPPDLVISGTAKLFQLITRASPALAAFLIRRLGFDRQMTQDGEAVACQDPALFGPASGACPVHGPFGRQARGLSLQLAGLLALALLRPDGQSQRAARPRLGAAAAPR